MDSLARLGVKPMLGRVFLPGEDLARQAEDRAADAMEPGCKRFGGRRDIVGQSVTLSGDAYTVVGVLPREFVFAPRANAEFCVPLLDKSGCEQRRSCHNLFGVGRLRDGVTMLAAREEMQGDRGTIGKAVSGFESGARARASYRCRKSSSAMFARFCLRCSEARGCCC